MQTDANQWKSVSIGGSRSNRIKYGKLKMWREGQTRQKAEEERYLMKAMKDKMSELTAGGVIKAIPLPDHTGMLFAPLTLRHYPHSHLL